MLDDINCPCNQANYAKLLEDPGYFLVESDLNRRNGYAIFEKTRHTNGSADNISAPVVMGIDTNQPVTLQYANTESE